MAEKEKNKFVKQVAEKKYEFGFTTDVQTDIIKRDSTKTLFVSSLRRKESPNGC